MSLARTIFVSVLSRVVGELLLRTQKTYLANVSRRSVGLLLREVAEKSLGAAERVVKHLPSEGYTEIEEWGIQVVVWRARSDSLSRRRQVHAFAVTSPSLELLSRVC